MYSRPLAHHGDDLQLIELGIPVVKVWSLVALESSGKLVSVLMKKGRPILEIWAIEIP